MKKILILLIGIGLIYTFSSRACAGMADVNCYPTPTTSEVTPTDEITPEVTIVDEVRASITPHPSATPFHPSATPFHPTPTAFHPTPTDRPEPTPCARSTKGGVCL